MQRTIGRSKLLFAFFNGVYCLFNSVLVGTVGFEFLDWIQDIRSAFNLLIGIYCCLSFGALISTSSSTNS